MGRKLPASEFDIIMVPRPATWKHFCSLPAVVEMSGSHRRQFFPSVVENNRPAVRLNSPAGPAAGSENRRFADENFETG